MLMGVLRQMDGGVHQGETKRHTESDEAPRLMRRAGFKVMSTGVNWV